MLHVHVCALAPRSGSTLLMELLAFGFQIEAVSLHEASALTRPTHEGESFLTKEPRIGWHLLAAIMLNKNLRVINIIRNPLDVICSTHSAKPACYLVGARAWSSALRWRRYLRNHPRYLEIRYEDLVATPDSVQRAIADYIPNLTTVRKFSEFPGTHTVPQVAARALNGLRPISTKAVGRWRLDPGRIRDSLRSPSTLLPSAAALGYKLDRSDIERLHEYARAAKFPNSTDLARQSGRARLASIRRDIGDIVRFICQRPRTIQSREETIHFYESPSRETAPSTGMKNIIP